jgi:hypothetical protein
MKIKQLRSSLTIMGLALLSISSPAAILEYKAVLGNPQTQYGSTTITSFTPVGATPKLTGTLNPGDQFRLVYSAPVGKKFKIEPTSGLPDDYVLFADWWTDPFLNEIPTPGSSIQFEGLTIPTPVPIEFAFSYDTQGRIRAAAAFPASEMSFRSITLLFDLPQSISKTFTNFEPATVRLGVAKFGSYDSTPLAFLIDDTTPEVPEPATFALSAAALAALALLRRAR